MAITQNTYTGDGATVLFSFTFEYITESDIKVTLNGTPTTAYTLATATSIQFNTAPANGVAIRIYRDTDIDTLSATFFPGSAIKAEDLNSNYTQNNYAAQEAKRESDAAVIAANSALSIVNSVLSYDPVANVAAIPAAPSDGDRIEVIDSTGIESFTPLTGIPSGFIGASTLTVRLIYSVTTWVWQDYQSTDPDSRYLKVDGDSTMTGDLDMGTNGVTNLSEPLENADAATKNYVDTQDATKLSRSGGTMSGGINMGTNKINNLGNPIFSTDAATKNYVDTQDATKLSRSGGTMSGGIAMNTNSITGLGDPSNPQDAATKFYVDAQDNTKLSLSGGTMTGDIFFNASTVKATNLQHASASSPAIVLASDGTAAAQVSSLNDGQLAGFRNVLINGNLTINQHGVDIAVAATGSYGQDRWKKTAGGMTQIIEEGNFEPSATYTLSGTNVTTQQLTAPASGNWTLPDIPVTARKIQLELGTVATPFERRPIGTELALCQRYFQNFDISLYLDQLTYRYGVAIRYPVLMRAAPTLAPRGKSHWINITTGQLSANTFVAVNLDVTSKAYAYQNAGGFLFQIDKVSLGLAEFISFSEAFSANAEL